MNTQICNKQHIKYKKIKTKIKKQTFVGKEIERECTQNEIPHELCTLIKSRTLYTDKISLLPTHQTAWVLGLFFFFKS